MTAQRKVQIMGMMDEIKDAFSSATGKVKEEAGDALDRPDLEAEGQAQQAEAEASDAARDAEDAAEDAAEERADIAEDEADAAVDEGVFDRAEDVLDTGDPDAFVDEPVVDDYSEPVVDEPVVDEPVVDEPVVDEPVAYGEDDDPNLAPA